MYFRMAKRLLLETDKRLLWKLAWNAGYKGMRSIRRHKQRLKRGEFFPPFLYVSITNSCNLRCQGCWVDVAAKQEKIEAAAMHRLINESREMGNVFFGIVGGEPFMHPQLLDILAEHPDCYFQIFTNGHFITPEIARRMRQLGNITPLVSVEGNEIVSDQRRGKEQVFSHTMQGLQNCLDAHVITGVCTSLCQTNMDLLTETWLDRLIEMGVLYTWFHIYRPVAPRLARIVPDPGAAEAGAPVRRRDAQQEADHHRRRLLRRRRLRAVSRRHRLHPSHQPVGRHRAVSGHPVREGFDPRPAPAEGSAGTVRVPA